jgi:hypothetical protein
MVQSSIIVEDSVEAELAYLYQEILLLDQLIRQLEHFARLSGQMPAAGRRTRPRKAHAARAGA